MSKEKEKDIEEVINRLNLNQRIQIELKPIEVNNRIFGCFIRLSTDRAYLHLTDDKGYLLSIPVCTIKDIK